MGGGGGTMAIGGSSGAMPASVPETGSVMMGGGAAPTGAGGFDFMKLFSPDFVQKAARMMDPSALSKMLTDGAVSMGQQGLKTTPMDASSMPFTTMLMPADASATGVKMTGREATGLQAPTGGGVGLYTPGAVAKPTLAGMNPEQLRQLAMITAQPPQQSHFAPPVAIPAGRSLPAAAQLAPPPVNPMASRASLAQILYGR